MSPLPFSLPPSLGLVLAERRAQRLENYLSHALSRDVVVRVAPDYQTMERDLLSGTTQAAWGPPFVCARTEAYGGRGLVRGIRKGSATYRSALVARRDKGIKLDKPTGLKAAWVDRDSTAGYLLPQAYLRERGVHGWQAFSEERFVGSYKGAVEDVLAGRVDLAAVWAPTRGGDSTVSTSLEELVGSRARELEVLGFTRECPNDGVVLSPRIDEPATASLERAFLTMSDDPEGRSVLEQVFSAERFEPAPRGSYRELYDLVFAALPK
jgi:phosphonate transport system substrate-binding protein